MGQTFFLPEWQPSRNSQWSKFLQTVDMGQLRALFHKICRQTATYVMKLEHLAGIAPEEVVPTLTAQASGMIELCI